MSQGDSTIGAPRAADAVKHPFNGAEILAGGPKGGARPAHKHSIGGKPASVDHPSGYQVEITPIFPLDALEPAHGHHDAARSQRVTKPVDAQSRPEAQAGGRPEEARVVEKTQVIPGKEKLAAGETPSLSVQYSDKPAPAGQKPTFVIDTNGNALDSDGKAVKALEFPQGLPKDIVIQVQHLPADAQLTAEQKKSMQAKQEESLNSFLQNTLNPALRQQAASTENGQQGLHVQDKTGLVNASTAEAMTSRKAEAPPPPAADPIESPPEQFSRQESAARDRMNGRHGMPDHSHGSMSKERADTFFPKGDPHLAGEQPQNAAQREMMAALFNPDAKHPEQTIRQREDGSYAVGRYGHSFNHFNNILHQALHNVHWPQWVMDELGKPPDWSKLSKILKEHGDLLNDPEIMNQIKAGTQEAVDKGEIPKSMAARFQDAQSLGKFVDFADKMKGKSGALTPKELSENFGKDAQDELAQKSIDRGVRSGKNPAQTALAQHLGIEPDQLTDAQQNDPKNKDYLNAATKYYGLAVGREFSGPNTNIQWQTGDDPMTPMQLRLAESYGSHVTGGTGWCARAHQRDLKTAGLGKFVGAGAGWQMGINLLKSGEWVQIDPSKARPGDSVYFHDASYLGDVRGIKERHGNTLITVNDHWNEAFDVSKLGANKPFIRNRKHNSWYDRSMVLRYIGDQRTARNQPTDADS